MMPLHARIRELKRLLKKFAPALETSKQLSRSHRGVYYGKHDRKLKAFRDWEACNGAYKSVKALHDKVRAELLTLQEQARKEAQRGKR